ncbi:hypothetical protein [Silvanigrella aquatica]|uniref:Uncharacterized protein n=1 Tax=Silvanigrella aquatica TaxID=1915309 RepID=A0A1L4CZ80_9BACT|nr:hypothetical protein [Silvanigrella aquatica]APJ03259.1 hypothetical protein AXG55_04815 [Silvanigrella aquatica]
MQTWILVESIHKHKEEFLPAKEFKHNLNKLTSTIKDLFYEFNKGDYINHYAQFTNAIDATIDLQNERYCDPEYRKKMNWEKKSIDLLEALNNLESAALKNLFGVQNDRY